MILADKIINLRKQNDWSQEEFALKMNVSRQAVSKWESAQTTPDLQKIIQMASLFGVSTDYLLKDEIEEQENVNQDESLSGLRKISLEEVNEWMEINKNTAKDIAYGVMLCILSPIALILLFGFADESKISEGLATTIGLVILLALVAMAVTIFVVAGNKRDDFHFLDRENFDYEYGVEGLVKERQKASKHDVTKGLTFGISLCIMAAIPCIAITMLKDEQAVAAMFLVCLTLVIVGIGVLNIVRVSIINGIYDRLLQVNDFTEERKALRTNKTVGGLVAILWAVTLVIYLMISFLTTRWDITWIVFPVAGILSGVIPIIYGLIKK